MVLTVPLRAAVDSCEGVSLPPAAGGLGGGVFAKATAAGQQADAQGGGEHQSKGSLFHDIHSPIMHRFGCLRERLSVYRRIVKLSFNGL